MFLIYVNDITDIVQSGIRLSADDTTLYIQIDDPVESATALNQDLESVTDWSNKWLVSFNPTKTKTLLISKKKRPIVHPNLVFEGTNIENVQQHKHLGVIFTSDLSWSTHVNYIVAKSRKLVGILKCLQYKLNRRALESLYYSFIRPTLEYASAVWDGCTQSDRDLLESVQLAAARVVTGALSTTSHTKIYAETGWETLAERRRKQKLTLMFKIINGLAPTYLSNLIPQSVAERTRYNI